MRDYLEKHEWARETLVTLYIVALELGYAIGMNMFIVPAGIYAGGLIGICQLARTLLTDYLGLKLPFDIAGVLYYLVNIPIFLYAWKRMRRRTLIKTIIAVSFSTLFLAVVPVKIGRAHV